MMIKKNNIKFAHAFAIFGLIFSSCCGSLFSCSKNTAYSESMGNLASGLAPGLHTRIRPWLINEQNCQSGLS